ncbi:complement factor H-like [Hemibagrus wyckioides]|nr:complement factor H-like [Hemibagrus wyckioides]
MKIILLVFLICSCLAVRGINPCVSPSVPNAQPTSDLKNFYSSGEAVTFVCDRGYGFEGTHYAVCDDGTWWLPVCKNATCAAPHVENGKPEKDLESSYAGGDTVKFVCDRGHGFEGTSYALCDDGIWRLPVCEVRDCGAQPHIENGDFTELPTGTELRVNCKELYKRVGPETVKCASGGWTELPVCKPPCKVDKSRISSSDPDEYVLEGQRKILNCPSGHSKINVQCTNGQVIYSHCLDGQ